MMKGYLVIMLLTIALPMAIVFYSQFFTGKDVYKRQILDAGLELYSRTIVFYKKRQSLKMSLLR